MPWHCWDDLKDDAVLRFISAHMCSENDMFLVLGVAKLWTSRTAVDIHSA